MVYRTLPRSVESVTLLSICSLMSFVSFSRRNNETDLHCCYPSKFQSRTHTGISFNQSMMHGAALWNKVNNIGQTVCLFLYSFIELQGRSSQMLTPVACWTTDWFLCVWSGEIPENYIDSDGCVLTNYSTVKITQSSNSNGPLCKSYAGLGNQLAQCQAASWAGHLIWRDSQLADVAYAVFTWMQKNRRNSPWYCCNYQSNIKYREHKRNGKKVHHIHKPIIWLVSQSYY